MSASKPCRVFEVDISVENNTLVVGINGGNVTGGPDDRLIWRAGPRREDFHSAILSNSGPSRPRMKSAGASWCRTCFPGRLKVSRPEVASSGPRSASKAHS